MGQPVLNRIGVLCLLALILTVTSPGRAMDADLYLVGLGLHQETGRNIYLGGIYLDRSAPRPDDLTRSTGTRVMEYRVVARRTSMRSLLGGMLLQSEVATGRPPDIATADFADAILSSVSTSLYAGDSLEIESTDGTQTVARLNGVEVARSDSSGVADYLLLGWIAESGPSTVFRNHITAQELDPELLTTLEANTYTTQRAAEIAALVGSSGDPDTGSAQGALAHNTESTGREPGAQTTDSAQETATRQQASEGTAQAQASESGASEFADASGPDPASTAVNPDAVAVAVSTPTATGAAAPTSGQLTPVDVTAQPLVGSTPAPAAGSPSTVVDPLLADAPGDPGQFGQGGGIVQVAALMPTPDMLPANPVENEITALGVQAYSQRLATFHADLVSRVYSEIRYPKRAVRRSLEGRLELDVTLTAQGALVNVAVARPSGHQLLDDAAMAAAEEAFAKGRLQAVDPVAIAEFGDFSTGDLVIPIPVSFQLQ